MWCVGWGRGAGEPLQSSRLGVCGLSLALFDPGQVTAPYLAKGLLLKFR